MNITISEMQKIHIQEVADIEKEAFSIPWSKKAFEESMQYEHALFLVAKDEEKNKIIGYVGLYKVFNQGDITNIAVLKEYQGRGIGKMLMNAIIKKAKEREIDDIMLEVRESNQKAITLYEKTGFASAGIRKNFYEKPVENAIVMIYRSDNCI